MDIVPIPGASMGVDLLQMYVEQLLTRTVALDTLNAPYSLISFTSVGDDTWSPSLHTVPADHEIDYYLVTCYGGGSGGGRGTGGGPGGRNGGRIVRRLSVSEASTSQLVTVGAGGLGATSDGFGSPGGISRFGDLAESVPGGSAIPTVMGDLASSARPGSGGDGGATVVWRIGSSTGSTNSTGSHSHSVSSSATGQPGSTGESSSGAAGGAGGRQGAGWWGTSVAAQAGASGSVEQMMTTGGGGGGGGGANSSGSGQAGAAGGAPGGGGGGGGSDGGGTIYSAGNGGNGGRGQVDVLAVFKPIREA